MDPRLIQAARSGSIDDLYALIDENPYVLEHVDVVPFINTPLHEAAASGNAAFAMEMMNLKPSFARKLNTNGFSPLHVALQNNQTRLILELLKVDPQLVRVKGREGTTPLHLAVEEGDVNLVAEFLKSCPECIKDVNVNRETAMHIAVANNKYEVLQVLTGCIKRQKDGHFTEYQALNAQDRDGNTALHLAAYKNQLEIPQAMKLLHGCLAVNCNIKNTNDMTVLDIIQANPNVDEDIENAIKDIGGKRAISLRNAKTISDLWKSPISFSEWCSTHAARARSIIPDRTRDAFLVICALIITATYQTALQPPSGVHQDDNGNGIASNGHNVAGSVIMKRAYFEWLWLFNTYGFLFSVYLIYLLLPRRSYVGWFLMISTPLCLSYAISMAVISGRPLRFFVYTLVYLSLPFFVHPTIFLCVWKPWLLQRTAKLIVRKCRGV